MKRKILDRLKDVFHWVKVIPMIVAVFFICFVMLMLLAVIALFTKQDPLAVIEPIEEDYW